MVAWGGDAVAHLSDAQEVVVEEDRTRVLG